MWKLTPLPWPRGLHIEIEVGCDVDWPVAVCSGWWYPDQLDSFEWKHPTGTCDTCNATNTSSVMVSQNHWNICLKHIKLKVYLKNKCKKECRICQTFKKCLEKIR